VTVDRTLHVPDGDEPHYYGPPKSAAGYRQVPLTESYAQVVAEHLQRFGTGTDGLVFTNRSSQPIRRKTLAVALGPILRDIGLPPRSGMHVFRHYYVSGLIAAGVDVLTVMRRVGHASSEETLGTYGHLWHDHEQRTRDAVEASFPVGRQGALRAPKALTGRLHSGAPATPINRHVHGEAQAGGA
jgi:integrase